MNSGNYLEELIRGSIERSVEVKQKLLSEMNTIEKIGLLAADRLERGGKVLLCGNGGSAADAQHIAAELIIRLKSGNDRSPLPAMSLALDTSTLTAGANDFGYEEVYVRVLDALGRKEDILIALSTSGNSENIVKTVEKARKCGMAIVTLLGGDGGKLKGMGDVELIVPSHETARIQESHILIGHIMCSIIEKKMFNLD